MNRSLNPVILADLDLNMIDNMFIIVSRDEIVEAKEEQQEQLKGDAGLRRRIRC